MMKLLKKAVPLAGIIIFAYIVYRVGLDKLLSAFLTIDPIFMALSLLLVPVFMILQTYKWAYLLKRQGISLRMGYLTKVYLIGAFYCTITPARIGSLVRILYIKKRTGKSLGECSTSVVIDKVMDIFAIFILAVLGALFLIDIVSSEVAITMMAVFLVFIFIIVLFTRKGFSRKMLKMVYRFGLPAKFKKGAHETFHSFYNSMPRFRDMIVPVALSIASWVVIYSISFLIAMSLQMDVPFHVFVTTYAIASIVGLIPITVGGWGTREATLIAILSLFAVSPEKIVVMSIITFILSNALLAALGAGFAMKGGLKDGA